MTPKILKSDIRYRILEKLANIGHATEQVCINDFLKEIRTYNGEDDIGTIRRALEDLERENLIVQSVNKTGAKHFSEELDTTGMHKAGKSTIRFEQEITIPGKPNYPKINPMFFYLTLKGKGYLATYEKKNWYHRNKELFLVILGAIIGLFGSIIGSYLEKQPTYNMIKLEQIHTLDKNHIIVNKDSLNQISKHKKTSH